MTESVPFGDLKRQHLHLRPELDAAIARVLDSGWYILGQEVDAFEHEFAEYCGARYGVGVASGAEALYLALAALEIGSGDEVVTVANACMYQIAAIVQAGATSVLVDIDPSTCTMDPAALQRAISPRTRAIIPVHLYGRLADMPAILQVAASARIPVIEDAAQAHGAWMLDAEGRQRRAGAWGTMACFSFYPSKNLGAIGDAGAVVTNDRALAERLKRLRMYGWGERYQTRFPGGRNSRLDEMQAAILRVKLRYLDAGNAARRAHAEYYRTSLASTPLILPPETPGHVYHLFVIESDRRQALHEYLRGAGIGCDVHYPFPAHLQPAYASTCVSHGKLPVTERLAGRLLSLPMFPELTTDERERVVTAIQKGTAL